MENNELFICACGDTEHQLIMSYFDDDNIKEVFCSVHLCKERNLLRRLKNAIKYIFGYTSRYGDFDEFIFKSKDWVKLQKVVDFLKENGGE